MSKPVLIQLGGSHFQTPLIRRAREMGIRVIVCDRNPMCPGRACADEYAKSSTIDVDAIRRIAIEHRADGISAYASDPGALTAAVVAESLGLPGNRSAAVRTVSRKDLLRDFQRQHAFHAPDAVACEDSGSFRRALERINIPCIVKPVDSSGSRGVSALTREEHSEEAFQSAMRASACGRVIVEELVQGAWPQIAGDGFIQNGRLVFTCFGEETFDACANPLAPVAECFPLSLDPHLTRAVRSELERFVESSGLRTGPINFDVMIGGGKTVHLIDIGARSGGNGIPELLRFHTGFDTIQWSILAALGEPVHVDLVAFGERPLRYNATYVIHSRLSGVLRGLSVDERIKPHILELRFLEEKRGEFVRAFTDSGDSLGYALLEFETQVQMRENVKILQELIHADVQHRS